MARSTQQQKRVDFMGTGPVLGVPYIWAETGMWCTLQTYFQGSWLGLEAT